MLWLPHDTSIARTVAERATRPCMRSIMAFDLPSVKYITRIVTAEMPDPDAPPQCIAALSTESIGFVFGTISW